MEGLDDLEVCLPVVWFVEDVELLSDEADAAQAVRALDTVGAAHEVVTVRAPDASLELAALMAVLAVLDVVAVSAANALGGIVARVALATPPTEHTAAAVVTPSGVEAVRGTSSCLTLKAGELGKKGLLVHGRAS